MRVKVLVKWPWLEKPQRAEMVPMEAREERSIQRATWSCLSWR